MPSTAAPKDGPSTPTPAIVGILDLQVIVAQQGGSWVAQAIELDYAAAGDSVEDVKRRFEDGLCATIHEHLRMFGDCKKLTEQAMPNQWMDLLAGAVSIETYNQVSHHGFMPDKIEKRLLPFGNIKYLVAKVA